MLCYITLKFSILYYITLHYIILHYILLIVLYDIIGARAPPLLLGPREVVEGPEDAGGDRKGTNGVSTNGVTANCLFVD